MAKKKRQSDDESRHRQEKAGKKNQSGKSQTERGKNSKIDSDIKNERNEVEKTGMKAEQRRHNKTPMSTTKKVTLIVCILLLVLVCAAIAVLAIKMFKIETVALDPEQLSISTELEYDEKGYLNVALFGLDTRENDLEMGSRSDTMIIASLNRETKQIKLVSVFRDTYMQQEDGSYNKANAAYNFGQETEAISQLNRNLDMNIKHYVTVDFSAMVDMIDALGGIPIEVQQDEIDYINGYATSVSENTGVEKKPILYAGLQTLDGVQATSYARIRQVNTLSGAHDDFGRTERQRTVLKEIAKKAKEASLAQLGAIIDRVFPKIRTNFTMMEILAYAKDAGRYDLTETTGFPFELTSARTTAGDTIIADTLESNAIELHRYLFGEDGYSPSSTLKAISSEIESMIGAGYTDSDYTDPDYTDPNYTDPNYTDPNYIDPNYTDPNYTDPNYTDPNYTDPNYTDPNYTDPNYTDPNYTDPNYTDPNYTDPNYTDPNYTDPNYTDPNNGYTDMEQNYGDYYTTDPNQIYGGFTSQSVETTG